MVLTPSRSVLHCAPIRLQAFVTQQAPVGKTPAMATVSGLTGHCTVLEESTITAVSAETATDAN